MPKLPASWEKSFGKPLFKLLQAWRNDAIAQLSQKQLDEKYATVVERVGSKRSRRSGAASPKPSSTSEPEQAASTSSAQTDSHGNDDSNSKRRRIRLASSRRVVTEQQH